MIDHLITHEFQSLKLRKLLFVGSLRSQCVIDIGYGTNPCIKMDFLIFQVVRISRPVHPFMVLHYYDLYFLTQLIRSGEHPGSVNRMSAYNFHFVRIQFPWLVQDIGVNGYFSHVMEEKSCTEFAHVMARGSFKKLFDNNKAKKPTLTECVYV